MLDYHAPYQYPPADRPRGVGVHPHRGFETVTLAFEGSVAHHDSTGAGGVIHPGDVQRMTAASGILHKEYHEADWAKTCRTFHMVQLWVNLPAAQKMGPPRYQPLTAEQIGSVDLPDGAGVVRVIAGRYNEHRGPAQTATPINLWDLQLTGANPLQLTFPPKQNTALLVLDGTAVVNGTKAGHRDLVVLDNTGEAVMIEAEAPTRLLLLNGDPIDEPVEAYEDFKAGRFGHLED